MGFRSGLGWPSNVFVCFKSPMLLGSLFLCHCNVVCCQCAIALFSLPKALIFGLLFRRLLYSVVNCRWHLNSSQTIASSVDTTLNPISSSTIRPEFLDHSIPLLSTQTRQSRL